MEQNSFQELLDTLITLAEANNQILTTKNVLSVFPNLKEEQLELIFQYLESQNITISDHKISDADTESRLSEEKTAPVDSKTEPSQFIQMYLDELSGIPTLSKEETASLISASFNLNSPEEKRLIEGHLYLVPKIAERYQNRGLTDADLIQEGNLGLINGVRSFLTALSDSDFETHIICEIKNAMEAALNEQIDASKISKMLVNKVNRLDEAARMLAVKLEREATVKELADYLHLSEDEIKEIMKISLDAISTDDTSISSQHFHHHHESE